MHPHAARHLGQVRADRAGNTIAAETPDAGGARPAASAARRPATALDVLKHLRSCVLIWSTIVLAMLIWASYEMLRPKVEKWMTPKDAIHVFSPIGDRSWYEEYSQKLRELDRANDTLYLEIYGKPDSPGLEDLKKRKYDIEGQAIILQATLQTSLQSAAQMFLTLLQNGKLLAKALDVEKGELTMIPTPYWKSMSIVGEQLDELGGAGSHHYRSLLIGENPCYAIATNMQALRCTLPLATP